MPTWKRWHGATAFQRRMSKICDVSTFATFATFRRRPPECHAHTVQELNARLKKVCVYEPKPPQGKRRERRKRRNVARRWGAKCRTGCWKQPALPRCKENRDDSLA